MKFSPETISTAAAIVNVFETGRPFGDFAAYAVLDDGAGVSYGVSQFTHRSGALAEVIAEYLKNGGVVGRAILEKELPELRRADARSLRAAEQNRLLEKALRAAALTREMRAAQTAVRCRRYLTPAAAECAELGLRLPLALAVVYDSLTHGSFAAIRDAVSVPLPARGGDEKRWLAAYVRRRHAWLTASPRLVKTAYRTRFFLQQIAAENWQLRLPLRVRGLLLSEAAFGPLAFVDCFQNLAAEPATFPIAPETRPDDSAGTAAAARRASAGSGDAARPDAQPPNGAAGRTALERVERAVGEAADDYDRVEAVTRTILTRGDAAKSLWTAVIGTIWQAAWAIAGFVSGVPRSIWLAAAVIAGALALAYLYRQIALGKIRERQRVLERQII